jgi:type III secretion system needle length determinant
VADKGKADAFRDAMRKDARKDAGEEGLPPGKREPAEGDVKDAPREAPPAFSGDALLRGMGSGYAPLAADAASSTGVRAEALVAELAERILVARADQPGESREVRITLRESVLPDTEIILRRDGERLIVSLLTDNASSHQVLQRAQQDLREKLLVLDAEASVEVIWRDAGGQAGNGASSGRSRGLDYLPDKESA